ncbi:MAG TPA: AraC family transcriptional regulator [Myxococcales bacterium]|nr:AraC family transcriptional regulator [Myxococcales bacterium]
MTETPDVLTDAPDPTALLEEALRMVHLSGAVFLLGEFTEPWAFAAMEPRAYAAALCPGAESLVLFHIVLQGRCDVWLRSGGAASLAAGEAVVLPYCDPHAMGYPRHPDPPPVGKFLPSPPWRTLPIMRVGDGASSTRILCGYLRCDDLLFQPQFKALPPLIHVRPATRSGTEWLRASAQYELEQTASRRPTGLSARLPELLLLESLRQHLAAVPASRTGWLAALRDPVVGRALQLLHASPAENWTVPRLARSVAVSRTVLGDRFAAVLGRPPMRYLAQWRLQLATHLLRTTAETLPQIAGRVGYGSEAAFSRAFKRGVGEPPAAWRRKWREPMAAQFSK